MKFKNYLIWLPLVFSLLTGIYACSHQPTTSEVVDEEARKEESTSMGGPVAARGMEVIQNSKSLNEDQKSKLIALSQRMMQEMAEIRKEEGQLKMVLFRSLVDPKSDNKKINTIKGKILSLDRKKTDKMLSALDEAQTILGRKSLEDETVYRALMMDRFERQNY